MPVKPIQVGQQGSSVILTALQPKQSLPDKAYDKIAAVHNSSKGHWGQRLTRKRLNDPLITDRMISQFIRQCPCCQVMSRIHLQIKTHPFTCASYNPFEVLHLDHIGPLRSDAKGHTFILVIIDAFSRWVELYPTTTTTAVETASCIFQHFGRFGNPDVVHTDRGTAFDNEIIEELLRMTEVEQSLTTAYSSEENGTVERANQEVVRHLNAILFDSRVHDRGSFEQLPMVQRIMNTVEKTSTGVTPAQLILNNSVQLSKQILRSDRVSYPPDTTTPSQQIALSDRMEEWISKQSVLLQVARDRQTKSDFHHGISSELIRALHTSFPATEVRTRSWKSPSEDNTFGSRPS
jgi:transposase InsO family protein